jgi:hypothetical protein
MATQEELNQDVIDQNGRHYWRTNVAHTGSWNALAARLDTEKGYPKALTKRAIPLASDAEQGTDGSFLLSVPQSFIDDHGAAFFDIITTGAKFQQLTKAEFQALQYPPEI